jgi:hypothetical protein
MQGGRCTLLGAEAATATMKCKPVSVSIAYNGHRRTDGSPLAHVILVDSDGNVHERIADMEPGTWITWEPSQLPERAKRNRKLGWTSRK